MGGTYSEWSEYLQNRPPRAAREGQPYAIYAATLCELGRNPNYTASTLSGWCSLAMSRCALRTSVAEAEVLISSTYRGRSRSCCSERGLGVALGLERRLAPGTGTRPGPGLGLGLGPDLGLGLGPEANVR